MATDVLERAAEALVSLDAERLVSLYADEFVFEDTSSGDTTTEKQGLRQYFDRLFGLPEVSFTEVSFFRCGERGGGAWTWSGKSVQSGTDYAIKGASLFELGEDEIKREAIFYDPREAYV